MERFDLDAEPEVGAELLRAAHEALGGPGLYYAALPAQWRAGRRCWPWSRAPMAAARLAGLVERASGAMVVDRHAAAGGLRAVRLPRAVDAAEIDALVARIAEPDVLTGKEIARAVYGVDLATDPLAWLTGPAEDWRIALDAGEPVGLVGTAGDACYPLLAYLGVLDRPSGLNCWPRRSGFLRPGEPSRWSPTWTHRVEVLADLERNGFRQVRSRVVFEPPNSQE